MAAAERGPREICWAARRAAVMNEPALPELLTHYYRPFSRPLLSLSDLPEPELSRVLDQIAEHEPLPYRLTQPDYLPQRRRIEARMRTRFVEKGGRPDRQNPRYFVLGEFSLWESDRSSKVQIPLRSVPADSVSFTLTDSFFNYRRANLRGVSIQGRPYHDELYTLSELASQLEIYDLPTEEWRSHRDRRFEVYVEAQLWSDEPIEHLLGHGRNRQ